MKIFYYKETKSVENALLCSVLSNPYLNFLLLSVAPGHLVIFLKIYNYRFLFEKEECGKRILYTGDFRLEDVRLPTLTNLHNLGGEPLKIDLMYLDTTFCSKDYEKFPPRRHADEGIWELVNSWIRKNGMIFPLKYFVRIQILN